MTREDVKNSIELLVNTDKFNIQHNRWYRECEELIIEIIIEENITNKKMIISLLQEFNDRWNKKNKQLYKNK